MTQAGIELLTDQPIRESDSPDLDGLGFNTYARVLARSALGTEGPFTIGIFGEWGTGKTSLMRMIKRELDSHPEVATVWFNAWQYEQEDHPIVPLLATILQGLTAKPGFLDKLGERGQRLLNLLRSIAYGSSFKASVGLLDMAKVEAVLSGKDLLDKVEDLSSDPLLEGSIYHQAFGRLEEIDLGEGLRIVVLIDDLDRCMPDRAIKLLESIKLVLSQPGFIFILAVSRDIIEKHLEHRYAEEYGIEGFLGRRYLDKIVQLPFGIPPHSGRMEQFSKSLLSRLQPNDSKDLEGILPLIGVACRNNPRATVRFVNNLLIDKAINRALLARDKDEQGMDEIPILYFAIARALQQRWWEMWSLLVTSDELCSAIADWLPGELASHTSSDDHDVKEAASILVGDRDLQELLFKHGKAWLKDSTLRNSASQFLERQRQEVRAASHVILFCDGHDVPKASQIADVLAASEIRTSTIADLAFDAQQEYLLSESLALVGLVGSSWKEWEEVDRVRNLMAAQQPLYLLLLPEAEDTKLPELLPNELTIKLSPGEVRVDELRPLIRSVQRLSLQRPSKALRTITQGIPPLRKPGTSSEDRLKSGNWELTGVHRPRGTGPFVDSES